MNNVGWATLQVDMSQNSQNVIPGVVHVLEGTDVKDTGLDLSGAQYSVNGTQNSYGNAIRGTSTSRLQMRY